MHKDIPVETLLGAYLCADVTPEERSAIEDRLAVDGDLAALLAEYKELLKLIDANERHVTPAMVDVLKQRVGREITERLARANTSSLLAASLTDDLNPGEKKALGAYVETNPAAKEELQSLVALSGMLKENEKPVSDTMVERLKARLQQKLPAAALQPAGKTPVSVRPHVAPLITTSARDTVYQKVKIPGQNKTVRVIASVRDPWQVWRWAVAAAAAILIVTGTALAVRSLKTISTEPDVSQDHKSPHNEEFPAPLDNNYARGKPEHAVPPPIAPVQPQPLDGLGIAQTPAPRVSPPLPPAPTPDLAPMPAPSVAHREDPLPEHTNPPLPIPQAHADNTVAIGTGPSVSPLTSGSPIVGTPGQPNPNSTATPTSPVGGGTTSPPHVTAALPAPGPPIADRVGPDPQTESTKKNRAVVALVTEGATLGLRQTLVARGTIISPNEQLVTGRGKVAIFTPNGGHLYVNRDSSLSMTVGHENTTVNLDSGEISYRASPNGLLTVNVRNVKVSNAKAIDVLIQGNSLIVTILKDAAHITAPGVNKMYRNSSVTIDLSGVSPPVINTQPAVPDAWIGDVLLGDGGGDLKRFQPK